MAAALTPADGYFVHRPKPTERPNEAARSLARLRTSIPWWVWPNAGFLGGLRLLTSVNSHNAPRAQR
jgi:hypothetical protein